METIARKILCCLLNVSLAFIVAASQLYPEPAQCSSDNDCLKGKAKCVQRGCHCTDTYASGDGKRSCERRYQNSYCVMTIKKPHQNLCKCKVGYIGRAGKKEVGCWRNKGGTFCLSNKNCDQVSSTCRYRRCQCKDRFVRKGDSCVPECQSNAQCKSHSKCHNGKCTCLAELLGDGRTCRKAPLWKCRIDHDCDSNAKCKDGLCICQGDTIGNGRNCRWTVQCPKGKNCGSNENCVADPLLPTSVNECRCKKYYKRDKQRKCVEMDGCEKKGLLCPVKSTCQQVTPNESYECICDDGFQRDRSGVSVTCKDIDECSTGNATCSKERCSNTIGSYTCTPCPEGSKDHADGTCVDIDECASSPCKNSVKCANLLNRFECTCLKEYKGKTCEVDVDECLDKPCRQGICVNHHSGYSCKCTSGYTANHCQFDIDECDTREHGCGTSETCVNTPGSYKCVCVEGYTGPKCHQNIDECASTPCNNDGMCANLINRFECTCLEGYIGKTCEVESDRALPLDGRAFARDSQRSKQLPDAEQSQFPWGFYNPLRFFVRYKGDHLMINCSTTDPTDYVVVRHKHKKLSSYEIAPDGKRIRQDGPSFILRNLTHQDSGLYTCQASKGDERRIEKDMVNVTITKLKPKETASKAEVQSTTTNLNGSKPYIYFDVRSPVRMSIIEKKPCNLTATIKGLQPIKIHWMKDEHNLVIDNKFSTFNNKRRLVIEPPFDTEDSGTYSVVACNTNGCQVKGIQVLFYTADHEIANTATFKGGQSGETSKKIAIIGALAILTIVVFALFCLKKNKTKTKKKTNKRGKKRKERKQRAAGRLASLWPWHHHLDSEDSSHDEMPDYSHSSAEFFDLESDEESGEGRKSRRSSKALMYDDVTSYENIYASYDGHVQKGPQPMMAHVEQIQSSKPHAADTDYEIFHASYDSHVQKGVQPMKAHVEQSPSSEPHAADTDYDDSDDSYYTDESH